MYLTKIDLSIGNRGIQRALGDCQELHRMVMGLFETGRKDAGVLYRLRERGSETAIYLYSAQLVQKARLLPGMRFSGERDLSHWLQNMREGQIWQFDLLASPCKKVAREGKSNSQRRVLRTIEERCGWLARKGEQNGFQLISLQELEGNQRSGRHTEERGGRMYLDSYHYQGALRVTDAEQFREAVRNGVGPGKSYGLGMLLLHP